LLAVRNIQFSYHYDKSILKLQLEMEKRKNFYLVFKEAINNTIKYSGASELSVTITQQHHLIELMVKDNGVGFNVEKELNEPSQSLSGNGLRNMQARAKDMEAQIVIESKVGAGTTIKLSCPVS
jgi:signal transduction histidine kinase